jgi:hypothetical protein
LQTIPRAPTPTRSKVSADFFAVFADSIGGGHIEITKENVAGLTQLSQERHEERITALEEFIQRISFSDIAKLAGRGRALEKTAALSASRSKSTANCGSRRPPAGPLSCTSGALRERDSRSRLSALRIALTP